MKEVKGDLSSLKGDLTSINETISQQYETTRSLNETVKGLSEDLVEHKNQTTSELAGLQTTLQSFTNNTELINGAVLLTRLPYTMEEMNFMTNFTNLISEGASKLKRNLDEHRNQTTYELADLQSSMDTLDSKLVSLNVSVTEELRSLNDRLDAKLDELPQNMTELISEKATSIDESVSSLRGVLEMYKNWTMSELNDLQNSLQSFITTTHSGLLTQLSTKMLSQNFSSLQRQINAMVNPLNSTLAAVNTTSTLMRDDLNCVKTDLRSLNDSMNRVCDKMEEHEDHMTAELMELDQYLKENFTRQINNNINNLGVHTCGGTGGWRRAVYLDMTDPNTDCPSGWRELQQSRKCGRATYSLQPSCDSVTFPVTGGGYNKVCGRIKAYQWGLPGGFLSYNKYKTLDGAYFSGVGVMHGSPRQHIWTFAVGFAENYSLPLYFSMMCPCESKYHEHLQPLSLIGEDYFCESGYIHPGYFDPESQYTLHSNDTLWDGKDCHPNSTCCSRQNPPYFTKTLSMSTTDDIELRMCGYNVISLDNVGVELIELYVKDDYIEDRIVQLDQQMKQSFAHQSNNINNLAVHTCGGTGGWRRAVYLDMTDPSMNCPSGWRETGYSKRTCGRATGGFSCDSVTFPIPGGGEYSQVCGRIKAFQSGYTTGFRGFRLAGLNTTDDAYFTGVNIMHGSPRQHIWTFAVGLEENFTASTQHYNLCPCDTRYTSVPSFVGEDYFCESGYIYPGYYDRESLYKLHSNDTLWDGKDCHSSSTCCSHHNPPYFTKTLNMTTTDDIELRMCGLGGRAIAAVEVIELYVI